MSTLAELEDAVMAFQRQGPSNSALNVTFETLLARVVAYQSVHIPALSRFWAGRGLSPTPSNAVAAERVPPVPTDVFRSVRLVSDERDATRVFRTSGTTAGQRGESWRLSTGAYDAGAVIQFRASAMRNLSHATWVPLVFDPAVVTDSSLSHMVGDLRRHFDAGQQPYFLHPDRVDTDGAWRAMRRLVDQSEPVLVFGTAFALVELLDAEAPSLTLPAGSIVVETGGFKGRSREVSRETLYDMITDRLGVPNKEILSEYSMTELSSQLYTSAPNTFAVPHWVRIVIRDPQTLAPLPMADQGLVSIVDLANIDVPVAILTSDFGALTPDGLVLHGRAPGATPRGCSLAVEEVLAIATRSQR